MKSNNSWILLKSKADTIPLETIPSSSKGRPDPIYPIIFSQLLSGSAMVAQAPLASMNHEAEVMGWGSVLGWMSRISSGLGFLQSLFTLRIKSTILETSAVASQSSSACLTFVCLVWGYLTGKWGAEFFSSHQCCGLVSCIIPICNHRFQMTSK